MWLKIRSGPSCITLEQNNPVLVELQSQSSRESDGRNTRAAWSPPSGVQGCEGADLVSSWEPEPWLKSREFVKVKVPADTPVWPLLFHAVYGRTLAAGSCCPLRGTTMASCKATSVQSWSSF